MLNKFIVVEGNDGCGKGEALRVISDFLKNDCGVEVLNTREPGGTPMAEQIRNITKSIFLEENFADETELLLMFAARSQLVSNVIRPALSSSKFIISDRFTTSTYAYQGYSRGIDLNKIKILEEMIVGDCKPSLTIILDCPPEISLKRARGRGDLDRIEKEYIDFFHKSRNGYLTIAKDNPESHIVIDSNKDLSSVQKDVLSAFSAWFYRNFK